MTDAAESKKQQDDVLAGNELWVAKVMNSRMTVRLKRAQSKPNEVAARWKLM